MRRRDLRTSLGGLPRKMLHPVKKATKSCNEIPQTAVAFCAFSSLFARKKFDCAQDDRLIFYFAVCVCLAGRRGCRPLRWILLCSVGAIHESPAFMSDNRSFSGGASPSPTGWLFVSGKVFVFREAKRLPYDGFYYVP